MASLQILIVEDHEVQSNLLSFLLQEAGHIVQIAASAEEALEKLRSFSPELILLDLQLPGRDGLELTRLLQRNPALAATPIVALTTYADPSNRKPARGAGFHLKVPKPIDAATLANPEPPTGSGDLLTEIRNNFLVEGQKQCGFLLDRFDSGPACSDELIQRILRRWAEMAGILGLPEISDHARKTEALLAGESRADPQMKMALEIALRKFSGATPSKPELPAALILGLTQARIGLMNFSPEETNRIRNAVERAGIGISIEPVDSGSLERQTGFDALVINECADLTPAAVNRPALSVPAVIVSSRSSLQSLSKLSAHACDFLLAPWDAEEILIRVSRLLARAAHQPDQNLLARKASRPRILIADDDPDMLAMLSVTFQHLEMDCDLARSGEQAVAEIQRHPPDAVILDVNMADLDGFEVLKRLRRNLITREIPVLLLTARGQESDIARGFGSGANDYVVKPFKPLDLVKRVDSMISASRKARAAL